MWIATGRNAAADIYRNVHGSGRICEISFRLREKNLREPVVAAIMRECTGIAGHRGFVPTVEHVHKTGSLGTDGITCWKMALRHLSTEEALEGYGQMADRRAVFRRPWEENRRV